jgi:hypothetical protein
MNWVIDTAIDWGIDREIETAIEIASYQTKSAQRETEEIQPAKAGLVCVDAVSTAVCMKCD